MTSEEPADFLAGIDERMDADETGPEWPGDFGGELCGAAASRAMGNKWRGYRDGDDHLWMDVGPHIGIDNFDFPRK